MSLRGICPCCHAMVSLDAMVSDDDARALVAAVAEMPGPVGRAYVRYLGLFRHASRAVGWGKLLRLTRELAPLIQGQYVARDGRRLPAPHSLWIEALDGLVERRGRPGFKLPLNGHGYLLEVVLAGAEQQADAESRAAEAVLREREEQLRRGVRTEPGERSGPRPRALTAIGELLGVPGDG